MKGHKIFFTTILSATVLGSCASTQSQIIAENNGVIQYQSRCANHSATKEENLANSSHDMLLSTKAPKYPIKAARKRIEGYTKLEYDISPEGKPININVIEAYPSDVFNAAAIESFSGWRYKPQASSCQSIQLDFKLE
ncbi:energy transducer TonB [Thalassotalea sp. LPB0316]|uniref:energy transducer TonB n=1 Tax=Thalassotalea sp. LPB0316 TaxID=2769490 RepID=UPI001865C6EA|nr:energy transducer TonB [Thalassotalea sp. LPB0316]QOL25951.1 energy transducer TonB [Thalassotalea sp. LPB0316]